MVTVAWITPFTPDSHGGGGQIRQAHLLFGLAAKADVELISPGPVTDPAVRAALSRLRHVPVPAEPWRQAHPWLRRAADVAAAAGSGQPIEVRSFRPVRRALARSMTDLDADVVLVEYVGLAPLLPSRRVAPWILTFHNLASRMAAQQASIMPRRRQRWLLARDAAAAASFERRAAEAFDAVIACTAADAAALDGSGRVIVVPNGVDLDTFRPAPLPAAPRLVFTGALYTAPNADGATWFCRDILPLIRQQVPGAQIDLVGARPSAEVRALSSLPGVTVCPDVVEVASFLHAARVAVVPIRIGSGSRLKALEALAATRPMVGTTIGLEGLDLQPSRHFLLADTPDAFAAAVVRLLGDDRLATGLAQAGRAAVEERYGWSAIAGQFAGAVLAAATGAPGAVGAA
jgi:glycosyltransferase involved in cell wall biosynthesis